MGNFRNRAPRRKRRFPNLTKSKNNKTQTVVTESNRTSTSVSTGQGHTVVVDVVSILSSVSAVKDNIPTTTNNLQSVCDPLFVSKTEELISDKQSDEIPVVEYSQSTSDGSIIPKLEIEEISNETVIGEPLSSGSTQFKNMCRLCLAKDEGSWIDIFTNEPYDGCDEITPSNIAEIIEHSTTVVISKNDHLPNQLCDQCFLSLRFVHQFREKCIRSQSSLNSMVNASSERSKEIEQSRVVVNAPSSQQMKRLVKVVHLKKLVKPILKAKRRPIAKRTDDDVEMEEKGTGDVQCEFCGKVFGRQSGESLQYHLNRHNGVKPFACTEPFCDRSFYSPTNRKSHIINFHCTDPKFKCDICDKVYTKSHKLKIHRTTHFPPTIPCTICGKLLRSQATVYKHQKTHTERMFRCDCGKSFQNAYTLKVHRRSHTNEKPFICCKCGEAFAHNCLLKAHAERKHSE